MSFITFQTLIYRIQNNDRFMIGFISQRYLNDNVMLMFLTKYFGSFALPATFAHYTIFLRNISIFYNSNSTRPLKPKTPLGHLQQRFHFITSHLHHKILMAVVPFFVFHNFSVVTRGFLAKQEDYLCWETT